MDLHLTSDEPTDAERAGQLGALASLRAIGPLVGVALGEQLLTASMFAYIPLFLVDHHGVPSDLAGLAISVMAGIGIVSAPIGGALSDRFGRRRACAGFYTLAALSVCLLFVTSDPAPWKQMALMALTVTCFLGANSATTAARRSEPAAPPAIGRYEGSSATRRTGMCRRVWRRLSSARRVPSVSMRTVLRGRAGRRTGRYPGCRG